MMNKINTISIIIAIASALYAYTTYNQNQQLETLASISDVESRVTQSQILDLISQLSLARTAEYQKAFEDGRTQMGLSLMEGKSMANYSDGYHHALTQFSDFPPLSDLDEMVKLNNVGASKKDSTE